MTTPVIWKKVFEILDSDYLGINYDPSHFVWQMMDYIRPIYEFKDKIFHVHYKDIKIFKDKLAACGIMAYPLDYMAEASGTWRCQMGSVCICAYRYRI